MKQVVLSLLFATPVVFSIPVAAQQSEGYRIEVRIDNWEGDVLYFGYRRGEKIYSRDTVVFSEGKAVFTGQETLAPGIYMALMPPDNKFIEFLVRKDEQHFSLRTAAPDFAANLSFHNAPENELFRSYQSFLSEKIKHSQALQEQLKSGQNEGEIEELQKQLESLNAEVRKRQQEIIDSHPGTFAAKLIAAFREPEFPKAPLGVDENLFRWQYYRKHYFDGFDFSEEAFANSVYLKQKIDYYLSDKMTVQTPDSVIAAVDYILEKAQANEEVFKFLLPYLLNKYHTPEIMGLDAAFVHIADNYYATGKAHWTSEEARKKIMQDAYMNRFVLIGNKATNVRVQQYDPETKSFPPDKFINLYDVDAEYTVIFLWKPGCGHCKKTTDELKPFYEEWKPQDVEIFSISSANHTELDKAISDIEYKKMPWIVTADPFQKAHALAKFYGTSLPKLYVLDRGKNFIASRVAVSQLPLVITDHRNKAAPQNH